MPNTKLKEEFFGPSNAPLAVPGTNSPLNITIWGDSTTAVGVCGSSNLSKGVLGSSNEGSGVSGISGTSVGVTGFSAGWHGIFGTTGGGMGKAGVLGVIGEFVDPAADGVSGQTIAGDGVAGNSFQGHGVSGSSAFGDGVYATSFGGNAVTGIINTGSNDWAAGNFSNFRFISSGQLEQFIEYGLAGNFIGNVEICGSFSVYGFYKSFKIDHPLDPANKYLFHSSVESPDMKTIYDGVVILNSRGEATVRLPNYFEALNGNFRYQLTCIGKPSPNLHISQEVRNNRFRIAGGFPHCKVSWQVTGIRQDPVAKAHPMPVEVKKNREQRGRFANPELYFSTKGKKPEKIFDPRIVKAINANKRASARTAARQKTLKDFGKKPRR